MHVRWPSPKPRRLIVRFGSILVLIELEVGWGSTPSRNPLTGNVVIPIISIPDSVDFTFALEAPCIYNTACSPYGDNWDKEALVAGAA